VFLEAARKSVQSHAAFFPFGPPATQAGRPCIQEHYRFVSKHRRRREGKRIDMPSNNSDREDFSRRKFLTEVTRGLLASEDPAFSYDNLQTEMSSARGEIESRSHLKLSPKSQFALEMDHFGQCVQANKTPS
jgi:hypothetical protein